MFSSATNNSDLFSGLLPCDWLMRLLLIFLNCKRERASSLSHRRRFSSYRRCKITYRFVSNLSNQALTPSHHLSPYCGGTRGFAELLPRACSRINHGFLVKKIVGAESCEFKRKIDFSRSSNPSDYADIVEQEARASGSAEQIPA
jgi:hypothetical protein